MHFSLSLSLRARPSFPSNLLCVILKVMIKPIRTWVPNYYTPTLFTKILIHSRRISTNFKFRGREPFRAHFSLLLDKLCVSEDAHITGRRANFYTVVRESTQFHRASRICLFALRNSAHGLARDRFAPRPIMSRACKQVFSIILTPLKYMNKKYESRKVTIRFIVCVVVYA